MTDPGAILLPDAPVLVTRGRSGLLVFPDGEISHVEPTDGSGVFDETVILCHARATAARIGFKRPTAFDVLELFAFVQPGAYCLPTAKGLAAALGFTVPQSLEDEAFTLVECSHALLTKVSHWAKSDATSAMGIAHALSTAGWAWGPFVLAARGEKGDDTGIGLSSLRVWSRLEPFEDRPPPPPPGNAPVTPEESQDRLREILGAEAEVRDAQEAYARVLTHAFRAKMAPDEPNVVLAEAGTGVGKTRGYLAPSSVWAERNGGPVWISTFTRNLQRQLEQELDYVFPDKADKDERIVVRKGRENYLCLLNYEEALNRSGTDPASLIPLGLIARWITHTRSGDMVGGDFPSWLTDLFGTGRVLSLTDRRGECIYSACPHYRTCFVEKTIRKARTADIVVANHALVMVQAAMGGLDDNTYPTRYVFDEGHHVFGAADSAFSAHLSAAETADLRRWLTGAEAGGRPTRSRGLKRRMSELLELDTGDSETAATALDAILQAARALPAPGWRTRLEQGQPRGPAEQFLSLARTQVYTRAGQESHYSLQTETEEPIDGLLEAAVELEHALSRLAEPVKRLIKVLSAQLETVSDDLDSATRSKIEGLCRSLERRASVPLAAWRDMLIALSQETPAEFVDWFGIERFDGHDVDVGLHRHWVDPTLPFARSVLDPAHGVVVTSATLRDAECEETEGWEGAKQQVGTFHIAGTPVEAALPSPFDYAEKTRVFIVTDVQRNEPAHVAQAFRDLFLATDGGALGLFTAIARLRKTYDLIQEDLERAGLPVYAQHIDPLPTSTLVDIFREEKNSCLLGTDAVRDGVDVPGHALRLIVFDRVPWPRPDILHRARRAAFGSRTYDDRITRMRLKQAFGRLIRHENDRGVFVLLDPGMPSRLLSAFPDVTPVSRSGLSETLDAIRNFLIEP